MSEPVPRQAPGSPPPAPASPPGQVLHRIFEQTAEAHPQRIAVVCDGQRLTYQQLNQRAQTLAGRLRQHGVVTGDCVGLLLPRGLDVYVAILGILKAGAAYVPLDSSYPAERIRYILDDCRVSAIVTARALLPRCQGVDCQRLVIDDPQPSFVTSADAQTPADDVVRSVAPNDLCYVIYTSGSTGKPKGVQIEHRSAVHLVQAEHDIFAVAETDRVYQGFSVAFDASVEEIWLAFRSGATLVAGSEEMVHAGPDLARMLADAGVTVLSCVPTLLSMMHEDIPTVRLLIVGGETCPADLVRRWARPGRRMVNTYGPTEATVIATYGDVNPGEPVTIGKAVPGYDVRILDDSQRPVPPGQSGEICIGGVALARGYVGRDDLTRQRFVPDPDGLLWERLYRTGDLGRWTAAGQIEFLGRMDGQVKIRGFRVELSEIEAALIECPGVAAAAVTVRDSAAGGSQLIGYVVLATSPGQPLPAVPDEPAIRARLLQRLPPYMVPTIIEPLDQLPTLTSGKVDRKALPAPGARTAVPQALDHPPRSPMEKLLAEHWARAFGIASVSTQAHFFTDLGGHSLLAATVVSQLRTQPALRTLSVIDIYNYPTIQKLAAELEKRQTHSASSPKLPVMPATRTSAHPIPRWRYRCCAVGQAASMYLLFALFSLQWITPFFAFTQVVDAGYSRLAGLLACMAVLLLLNPLMLLVALLAKWLIIGRFRPGDYPLWGGYYFRWWLATRIIDMAPIAELEGTPLLNWYYRLMGARIGRDVYIGSDNIGAFDLVSVGHGTSLSGESCLSACAVEAGLLRLRPITVGRDCYVGAHAVLGRGSVMEDGSALANLSMLPPDGRIPAGQQWIGSPARPASHGYSVREHPQSVAHRRDLPLWLCALGHCLGAALVPLTYILAIFPGMWLISRWYVWLGDFGCLWASPLAGILFVLAVCMLIVAVKCLLLGKVVPGVYSLRSFFYIRKWFVDRLLDLTLEIVGPLYATLYFNPWYRLLGARLGKRAEISTAMSTSPDLLEIGDESFTADAVSLGAAHVDRGQMTMRPVKIGRRAFVGNSAMIPGGTVIGDDALIGVLSTPPATTPGAAMPGSSWLGSPAFFLPQRQHAAGFETQATYRPTPGLYAQRLLIEFFRISLPPTAFAFLGSIMITATLRLPAGWSMWQIAAVFPLLCMGCGILAAAFVIWMKWVLMGDYRPREAPLWSGFVWRTELITALHEQLANPFLVEMFMGTPFAIWFFRLMGCRIGKRVYLDSTNLTEFDLIEIGDDACLNSDCTIQTHLFEDRVMKMSHIRIGRDCVVGSESVVLYDTCMDEGSQLGELSLLMKGETLPAGTAWAGSPAQPLASAAAGAGEGAVADVAVAAASPLSHANVDAPIRLATTQD